MTKNFEKNSRLPYEAKYTAKWVGEDDSSFFVQLIYHYLRYRKQPKIWKKQSIGRVNVVFDTEK